MEQAAASAASQGFAEEMKQQNQSGFQLDSADWTDCQRTEADKQMLMAYGKL